MAMLKMCLACNREFEAGKDQCPFDGTSLIRIVEDYSEWQLDEFTECFKITNGRHYLVLHAESKDGGRPKVIRALQRYQDEDAIVRFDDELVKLQSIQHENVATVVRFGSHPVSGAPYMVLPFYDGGSLNELRSGLPVQSILAMAAPICSGLEALHVAGYVHPMLKPGHIMLDSVKKVVLIDLGSDYHVHDNSTLSFGGAIINNPAYMPPELVKGADLTVQSNVYSLSCIFYELLTGSAVFPGDNQMLVAMAHLKEQPRTFSEMHVTVPSALASTIMSGLEKDPKNRPQSVSEFYQALSL